MVSLWWQQKTWVVKKREARRARLTSNPPTPPCNMWMCVTCLSRWRLHAGTSTCINYVCLMSPRGCKTDAWLAANEQPFVFLPAWTKLCLQRVHSSAAGPEHNCERKLAPPVWAPCSVWRNYKIDFKPTGRNLEEEDELLQPQGWRLASRRLESGISETESEAFS